MPDRPTRIAAILLAAGASRRMGTPKALLRLGGEPLVRRVARTLLLGGADTVTVVVAPGAVGYAISAALAYAPNVRVAVNPAPDRGMLSSVQAGLSALLVAYAPGSLCAVLVCPCDLPNLEPAAVRAVVDRHTTLGAGAPPDAIVAPTHGGKRGHPTLFGSGFFPDILEMDSEAFGLNELLKRFPPAVVEVPVETDGALRDADTPEEWRAAVGAATDP